MTKVSSSNPQHKPTLQKSLSVLLLFLISSVHVTVPAQILSVSFFSSRSHRIVFEPLLARLLAAGHSLTIISPERYTFPPSNVFLSPNSSLSVGVVTQIIGPSMHQFAPINFIAARLAQDFTAEPAFFATILEPLCRAYLQLPAVQELLTDKKSTSTGHTHTDKKTRSRPRFDLIIGSAMMNECSLGYIAAFRDTPYILTIPFSPLAVTAGIFGAPSPSSFVPVPVFSASTHRMGFGERVRNLGLGLLITAGFHGYLYPKVEGVYRSVLGARAGAKFKSVVDIQKDAALILINSHFTLNYPRPMMPDMIEVGGLHCREGRRLSSELEHWLDGSGSAGFIYMSFGSVIRSSELPEAHRRIFLAVFSRLAQRVLWKWENETMAGVPGIPVPGNVRTSPWIPQQDVLAHSRIRLFITHGGLLSTQEAVYHGVPLVGLPIFADQDWNMAQSESSGFAVTLNFRTLTEEGLLAAIHRVLTEPSFTASVRGLSTAFKDRPLTPLDSAFFWTEYVLRHKGARHLRSAARDLNWAAYHSIDVIAFLAISLIFSLYLLSKMCALAAMCVCSAYCAIIRFRFFRLHAFNRFRKTLCFNHAGDEIK